MFTVAGFGNPLLDITVKIDGDKLLQKYNIHEDGQVEFTAEKINLLFNDISKYSNHISPGGCAQNTIRVLQWLLNKPNATIYFGGIGNDEQGKILTDIVQNSGVTTRYMINKTESTGICIALVRNNTRSLVAHLGAAEHFNTAAISNDEALNILKTVKLIYMEGFFVSKRFEVAQYIKEIILKNKTVFAFNISGVYICKLYPETLVDFAKTSDILFGNINEFKALGKLLNIDDPKKVALSLVQSYDKEDSDNPLLRFRKIVVITNSSSNVMCIYNKGQVIEVDVPKLPPGKIKDTTGAGDSFAAGFLAALLFNFDIEKSLKLACWTAGEIIQQVGCTVPNSPPNIPENL